MITKPHGSFFVTIWIRAFIIFWFFAHISFARFHAIVINDIVNLAHGIIVSGKPDEVLLAAAEHYNRLRATSFLALVAVVMSICLAGLGFSIRYINPAMRARVKVEQTVRVLMILCSTVAIFTTIGIVLSVLFAVRSRVLSCWMVGNYWICLVVLIILLIM